MTIKFDTEMKINGLKLSDINNTVFKIYVKPALKRDQFEDFENKTVALTWKAIKFEKQKM